PSRFLRWPLRGSPWQSNEGTHMHTRSKPVGLGRSERGDRRSNRQPRVTRTESEWENTGVFTGIGVKDTGRSDVVRLANRDMARRARIERGPWSRTLPKGVRI